MKLIAVTTISVFTCALPGCATLVKSTPVDPDFNVRDVDISRDGREAVLERVQDQSDVVLIDLAARD